jgi:hypothetical protein
MPGGIKATQEIRKSTTTFANLDCSSGIIYLTFPDPNGLDPHKRYTIDLVRPLHGQLKVAAVQPVKEGIPGKPQ